MNGYDRYDRSDRRYRVNDRQFNGPIRGRASVYDRLGGRLSMHDRLGDRVEYFPGSQEELEEMANAGMPILIEWNQRKIVAQRSGSSNFLHGVQKG